MQECTLHIAETLYIPSNRLPREPSRSGPTRILDQFAHPPGTLVPVELSLDFLIKPRLKAEVAHMILSQDLGPSQSGPAADPVDPR